MPSINTNQAQANEQNNESNNQLCHGNLLARGETIMTQEAKGSSTGLVVGAALGLILGGVAGDLGQALIFGALIGLVLGAGISKAISRGKEQET